MTLPFLCCAAMTAISALVSLGFSVAEVFASSGKARTNALYATSRSFALVVACLAAFAASLPWLEAAACCMIIVQACDAAVGVTIKSPLKTFGPAATAVFNLAALLWVLA